jgi:hypothetical protein
VITSGRIYNILHMERFSSELWAWVRVRVRVRVRVQVRVRVRVGVRVWVVVTMQLKVRGMSCTAREEKPSTFEPSGTSAYSSL